MHRSPPADYHFTPPKLPTLNQTPSWCNARGAIDRSACMEIKVSEARRLASCANATVRRAVNGRGRLAAVVITITARDLARLADRRLPRALAGDLRTARANAMRPPSFKRSRYSMNTFRCRVTRAQPIAWPPAAALDPNPNRGAARSKRLGLRHSWSQSVTIETWKYPRRIRHAYFFVCPGHVSATGLSTRKPGREHPSSRRCPQRCLKLMFVQCTNAELRDANLAQVWMNSLPAAVAREHRIVIQRLVARYGLILQPRTLLCPRCLGVRYGNNPETVRQGWRRRNHKPDVTFHGEADNFHHTPIRLSRQSRIELEHLREKRDPPREWLETRTRIRTQRRREWRREHYLRNAQTINARTVERRRRRRLDRVIDEHIANAGPNVAPATVLRAMLLPDPNPQQLPLCIRAA